jgi:hypothetical protein
MLIPVAIGLGIALITYFVRVWPRVGFPNYGLDVYFHLALTDVVRKERDRQKFSSFFLIGEYNDYPVLMHYLLSPISGKLLEKIRAFVSPLFEVLNAALLYWFTYSITGNVSVAFAAWLFYLASPQLTIECLTLTPRLLGIFFFNLWMLAMIIGAYYSSPAWAVVSVLAGTACFFTSRYQLPLMLAAGILLWAATGRVIFVELETAAFAISLCLSPKHFAHAFISYFAKTYDFARYWRFYGDEPDRLGSVTGDLPGSQNKRHFETLKKEIKMLFSFNPATWLMAAAGYWLVKTGRGNATHDIEAMLWVWFSMSFGVFIVTERFPQLGQRSGDGYKQFPMFGALPGAFLAGVMFVGSYRSAPIFFAFLAAGLAGSLLLVLRMETKGYKEKLKATPSYTPPEMKAILDKVRDYPWGNVMCLPTTYNYPMIYLGNKRVVEVVGRNRHDKKLIGTFYKTLELPLEEYIEKFELDYFFINTGMALWSRDTSELGEVVEKEGPFVFVRIFPAVKEKLARKSEQ